MSNPIALPGSTPALGLPLLTAGQAQKEFFVNEALCLLDALHARAVTASRSDPPANAHPGACFRVTTPATGAWAGHEDGIAVLIGDAWHFINPQEGMVVFDRSAGQLVTFRSQWHPAAVVALPAGGDFVDVEVRAAVMSLVESLTLMGVLATHPS